MNKKIANNTNGEYKNNIKFLYNVDIGSVVMTPNLTIGLVYCIGFKSSLIYNQNFELINCLNTTLKLIKSSADNNDDKIKSFLNKLQQCDKDLSKHCYRMHQRLNFARLNQGSSMIQLSQLYNVYNKIADGSKTLRDDKIIHFLIMDNNKDVYMRKNLFWLFKAAKIGYQGSYLLLTEFAKTMPYANHYLAKLHQKGDCCSKNKTLANKFKAKANL